MRRPVTLLFPGLIAITLMMGATILTVSPASAAIVGPDVSCNNGFGNGGAVCEVSITNTITPSGGSAVVTILECTGSAGVPDATCSDDRTVNLTEPVTSVTQCNGSVNGGGGTLLCSVEITNNFVGFPSSGPPPAVTVNQCVGSVTTGTVRACDPDPATTTSATITQCNGSGNGGGASLTCTATGTEFSGHIVTINQCNGSSNDGGTRTVCSASMTNVFLPAAATATPAPSSPASAPSSPASAPSGGPSNPVVPNTSVTQAGGQTSGGVLSTVVAGLVLLMGVSALALAAGQARAARGTTRR